VTTPITTPHFHSRVLASLSAFLSEAVDPNSDNITSSYNASPVVITPLTPVDTPLTPDDFVGQTVALTSSWIDLGSPDPVIADISKQVLRLELTYAAFCGITNVIIHGPRLGGTGAGGKGIVQFARVVLEALGHGPYMSIFIWLPMIDHSDNDAEQIGDLAVLARDQFIEEANNTKRLDLFGSWQAWDAIRSMCKYSGRLCVGKHTIISA
jgi:protein arginine N-methyltransferase 5